MHLAYVSSSALDILSFCCVLTLIVTGEISPLMPNSCRYVPTCSEYSMIAYKKYGVTKGTILTAWRLCRCNPLGIFFLLFSYLFFMVKFKIKTIAFLPLQEDLVLIHRDGLARRLLQNNDDCRVREIIFKIYLNLYVFAY